MNFQHPCVCKRQVFALVIHTFVLLAPDESLGSLDICEWALCCTSNGTRCSSPWWTTEPCSERQCLPLALGISFSVDLSILMPTLEETSSWWFKLDNLTLLSLLILFILLLEVVWTHTCFGPQIKPEDKFRIAIFNIYTYQWGQWSHSWQDRGCSQEHTDIPRAGQPGTSRWQQHSAIIFLCWRCASGYLFLSWC